jgi:cytochrome c-type biogenesis protein CcmH/NrfF
MNTTLKDAAEVAKDAADATVHRISDLVGDLGDLVSRPKQRRNGRSIWLVAVALVIVGIAVAVMRGRRTVDVVEDNASDTHRPAAARRAEVAIA